jgi:phosphopantothenoylcysteine decarboxylase / phosphopantothenate---cysteine ligase
MARIISVVCASVACYKYIDFARSLVRDGYDVETILTKNTSQFITPLLISATTGKKCHTEDTWQMEHISMSKDADCIVIFAATANFIAGLANGFASELGLSLVIAKPQDVKLVICPAMNTNMWNNLAVQRNIATLKKEGAIFIEPREGLLACGDYGNGHLADVSQILNIVHEIARVKTLQNNSNKAKKFNVIITTGGTIEKIDDVRYISNFSSGIQGIEIAKALHILGCNVLLIYSNISAEVPKDIQSIKVQSASQMLSVSLEAIKNPSKYFISQDSKNNNIYAFVSCAAVCDFYVANYKAGKVKKKDGLNIEFLENRDIVKTIAMLEFFRPEKVVAFAAEDLTNEKLYKAGIEKLKQKNVDIIVANSIMSQSGSSVFGSQNQNEVFIIEKNLDNKSKSETFNQIHLKSPTKTQTAQTLAQMIIG